MKKGFKAGLCAGLLALPLFAGAGSAFATGLGSDSQTVTVGDVATTVYSVDIIWGDMTHDYVYHDGMGLYTFKPRTSCTKYALHPVSSNVSNRIITLASNQGRLYHDSGCTELVEDYNTILPSGENTYAPGDEFYVEDVSGSIMVYDSTQNGKVKAQVSYTAADDYAWVDGFFVNHCTRMSIGYCLRPDMDSSDGNMLENDYLSSMGMLSRDLLYGHLVVNGSALQSEHEVLSGDTIGTVTVTISPINE